MSAGMREEELLDCLLHWAIKAGWTYRGEVVTD